MISFQKTFFGDNSWQCFPLVDIRIKPFIKMSLIIQEFNTAHNRSKSFWLDEFGCPHENVIMGVVDIFARRFAFDMY